MLKNVKHLIKICQPGHFFLVEVSNRLCLVQLDHGLAEYLSREITNSFHSLVNKLVQSYSDLPIKTESQASAMSMLPESITAPLLSEQSELAKDIASRPWEKFCSQKTETGEYLLISGLPDYLRFQQDEARSYINHVAELLNLTVKLPKIFESIQVGNYRGTWSTLVELDRPYVFSLTPGVIDDRRIKVRQKFAYIEISPGKGKPKDLIGVTALSQEELSVYRNSRTVFYVRRLATFDSTSLSVQREVVNDYVVNTLRSHKAVLIPLVVKQCRNNIFQDGGKIQRATHAETIFSVQIECRDDETPHILQIFGMDAEKTKHEYQHFVKTIHSVRFAFTVSPKFIPGLEPPADVFLPLYTSSFTIPYLSMSSLQQYLIPLF